MHWVGLIIVSIAVGHRYDQIDGWLTLGVGMIVFAILEAVLRRIPVRK
jgi:hypothetical protein